MNNIMHRFGLSEDDARAVSNRYGSDAYILHLWDSIPILGKSYTCMHHTKKHPAPENIDYSRVGLSLLDSDPSYIHLPSGKIAKVKSVSKKGA